MRTLATLVLAAVSLTACSRSKGGEEMKTPPTVARVGPTCDSLRSAGDDLLPQQAFMPLIDVIYRDGEKPRYGELTDPQRALVYTWHLEGEVNNGGFNQYFFNGGGETIDGAIQGFLFYGATEHSALAERARALFEKDAPRVEAARAQGSLETFASSYDNDPYDGLDKRFFELPSIAALQAKHIRANLRAYCRE